MRKLFQKKSSQIPCKLENGVFATPGKLTVTKKLLSFQPSNNADIDAGVGEVNIWLRNITNTSIGVCQQKLTIRALGHTVTFSGYGMTNVQQELKTANPEMKATRIRDNRDAYRLELTGKHEASLAISRLDSSEVDAQMVDLSTTGCAMLTGAKMRVGDYINLDVMLDGSTSTEVFGRCVRLIKANPSQNLIGVKFVSLANSTSRQLKAFIMKHQPEHLTTIEAA